MRPQYSKLFHVIKIAALFFAFSNLHAMAQNTGTMDPAEYFLPKLPDPSWKLISKQDRKQFSMMEVVPRNETAEKWTRMLTVQVFRGAPFTPEKIFESMKANFEKRQECEVSTITKVRDVTVQGYSGVQYQLQCTKDKQSGQGEYALMQGIQGSDAVYVIQRAWRGKPFAFGVNPVPEAEFKEWASYMDGVVVCDTRLPEKDCKQHLEGYQPIPMPK